MNTLQGLDVDNWSWKQTNVSFEAFVVGNQGWHLKGQVLRYLMGCPKNIFISIWPVHVHLKTDKLHLKKKPPWKKKKMRIFSTHSSSRHEKCCQVLQRLFWLCQCSKNPRVFTGEGSSLIPPKIWGYYVICIAQIWYCPYAPCSDIPALYMLHVFSWQLRWLPDWRVYQMWFNDFFFHFLFILVQLEGGHFQEQTQEYARWKELRDRLAADLRLSVSTDDSVSRVIEFLFLGMGGGSVFKICRNWKSNDNFFDKSLNISKIYFHLYEYEIRWTTFSVDFLW